jgi:hypothetical protein
MHKSRRNSGIYHASLDAIIGILKKPNRKEAESEKTSSGRISFSGGSLCNCNAPDVIGHAYVLEQSKSLALKLSVHEPLQI